jgi:endonuclease/exonuclease/phosphatase (EEP) superfamily protein YafD
MLNLITVLVTLPFVLGYLGALHPAFDSLSHFRLYALGFLVLWLAMRGMLACRKVRYAWWATTLIFGGYLSAMMRPCGCTPSAHASQGRLMHLQYNINLHNPNIQTIKDYILAHSIDIVTLQEVTSTQEKSLRQLTQKGYYWQAYCLRKTTQEAILSRHPFVAGSVQCEKHKGFISATIDTGEMNLTVASVHLFLPFPYGQHRQVTHLSEALKKLKKPLLIAGDFNAAPWSYTVKRVEALTQTRVVAGLMRTIPTRTQYKPYLPLAIDNVLVSPAIHVTQITTATHMGSDHWPVLVHAEYHAINEKVSQ